MYLFRVTKNASPCRLPFGGVCSIESFCCCFFCCYALLNYCRGWFAAQQEQTVKDAVGIFNVVRTFPIEPRWEEREKERERERKRENFRAVFGRQVRLVENLRVLRVKKCHFFRGNKLKIVTSVPDRFFVAINADSMPPLGCHEAARCGFLLYGGSYVHPSIGLGGLHRHPKCYCHRLLHKLYNWTRQWV
jgi:hypothetical protein